MRLVLAASAVFLVSCGPELHRDLDTRTVQDLKIIRNLKVYFGHQSVGANILGGLRAIEKETGTSTEINDSLIGVNGDPIGKCEDFARKLSSEPRPPDIALMKFCYIDFDENTDPAKLFERYAATLDGLKTKYPATSFLAVTTPLTVRTAGWKRFIKGLMGASDIASNINAKRAEFNRMVAAHYPERDIFDLAKWESTHPDGSSTEFRWESQTVFSLADEYSSDGGHLNAAGARRAAEGLIHKLAEVARARSARVSPAASGTASTAQ